jgi:hypothetical protein
MPVTPLIVLVIFFILWTHETLFKPQVTLKQKTSVGNDPEKTSVDQLTEALKAYLNDKSQ